MDDRRKHDRAAEADQCRKGSRQLLGERGEHPGVRPHAVRDHAGEPERARWERMKMDRVAVTGQRCIAPPKVAPELPSLAVERVAAQPEGTRAATRPRRPAGGRGRVAA